ncbi:MAG TPA: FAD-dependent monooxygenase, partial [Gaiellaceae bacterium]|nr:FAD-dependent monooxygenase [Gaiellaceae bacterium]
MVDCAVVGAGQAGLATSYHLGRLGVDHVVLERGRVAETWRTKRWASFFLNTPDWCTQLPGLEPPAEPDAFMPLADVVAMFTAYAERIEAPVRSAEVTSLRAAEHGFELG